MSEEYATHAAAAEEATRNECFQELALLTSAFLRLLFFSLVALVFRFRSGAEKACEQEPTHSTTPQQPAADQHSQQLVLFSALFRALLFAFITLALDLGSRAQKVRKQRPAHASATKQATPHERSDQLVLLVAALFAHVLGLFVAVGAAALVDEASEQRATYTTVLERSTTERESGQLLGFFGCWTHVISSLR